MLEAPIPRVDDMSLMDFAAHGDLRRVLWSKTKIISIWKWETVVHVQFKFSFSDEACQYVVHTNWIRGFNRMNVFKSLVCFFLPFMLFTPFVEYTVSHKHNLTNKLKKKL